MIKATDASRTFTSSSPQEAVRLPFKTRYISKRTAVTQLSSACGSRN